MLIGVGSSVRRGENWGEAAQAGVRGGPPLGYPGGLVQTRRPGVPPTPGGTARGGPRAARLLAYRAASINSGSPGFHRTVGSTAGVAAGTPMSTLAVSSAITTLPAVSIAARATPEYALAWV